MKWKFKLKCILVATGILVLIQFMNYEQILSILQQNGHKERHESILDKETIYNVIKAVPESTTKQLSGIMKQKSLEKSKETDSVTKTIDTEPSKSENHIQTLQNIDEKYPNLREKFAVPHKSHSTVPRALTADEYKTLMKLLKTVDGLLVKHNITYFMIYGTLIGSYMFHDIIPWDDDCDVLANNDSKALILELFANGSTYAQQYGIRAYSPQQFLVKLFFVDSPAAGKHKKFPWNFPFIDVAFYTTQTDQPTKVNILDKFHPMSVSHQDVFPLHRRPFGDLWLSAPVNTRHILQAKLGYKDFVCATNGWNHRREDYYPGLKINCDLLKEHYPIVTRTKYNDRTNESLWLNGTRYYDVLVDEAYQKSKTNLREYFLDINDSKT